MANFLQGPIDAWEHVPSFTRAVPAAGAREQRWIHAALAPEVTSSMSRIFSLLIFLDVWSLFLVTHLHGSSPLFSQFHGDEFLAPPTPWKWVPCSPDSIEPSPLFPELYRSESIVPSKAAFIAGLYYTTITLNIFLDIEFFSFLISLHFNKK